MSVIDNDDTNYWYQYMGNVFITNGFDSACMALSGADMDNLKFVHVKLGEPRNLGCGSH